MARCKLTIDGSFDSECLSSGISCDECGFLDVSDSETSSCNGNCGECWKQKERICRPI